MSTTTRATPSAGHGTRQRESALYRLGAGAARHPIRVILAWLVLLAAATVSAGYFTSHLTSGGNEVTDSESLRAEQVIEGRFPSVASEGDVFVVHSARLTAQDPEFRRAVDGVVGRAAARPEVISVGIPYTAPERLISPDGHTALVRVGLTGDPVELQRQAGPLQEVARSLSTPEIEVYLTGSAPLAAEIGAQGGEDLARAESIGFPAAAVVLVIAFGSLVAAGIPLLLGVVTLLAAFGVLGVAALFTDFDVFVQTAVSMVAIAVGIDYSLFIVTRFREELARATGDRAEAAGRTMETAGHAVVFSAITVVVALTGLLLVRAPSVHAMALGMIAAVTVMMIIAVTLLPAVLGLLGERINRLAVPWARRSLANPDPEHSAWARIAAMVMRRPLVIATVVTLALGAASLPVFQLQYGVDLGTGAVSDSRAGKGYNLVAQAFAPGALTPISVVAANRDGLFTDAQLDAIARFTADAERDARIDEVVSITGVLDEQVRSHDSTALAQVITAAHDRVQELVSRDGGAAVITIWSRYGADTEQTAGLVRDLRERAHAAFTPVGLTASTGGSPARIVDVTDESTRGMPLVVGSVLAASWVLLLIAFRSLVLPFLAIVMNLLTSGAAFGLAVLVFQEGHGADLFGVQRTGFVQVLVPLFAFALVFGLSMDYQVFMLSRMREEYARTGDSTGAVTSGITHTARVITAAATIMVVVFAAFMFTRNLEIKQMGFMLGLAVLIDATIVRLLLMPSLIRLMGRWAWWPARVTTPDRPCPVEPPK
ncbi:MMPL family transporter [Thermopolyspora sp. NPDC052614]|uniref:MMPL family transporter n=1 Tax=Thermopolyspora sp. NPDC052614 TaxID=3155682 RepID=UPI00343E9B7B